MVFRASKLKSSLCHTSFVSNSMAASNTPRNHPGYPYDEHQYQHWVSTQGNEPLWASQYFSNCDQDDQKKNVKQRTRRDPPRQSFDFEEEEDEPNNTPIQPPPLQPPPARNNHDPEFEHKLNMVNREYPGPRPAAQPMSPLQIATMNATKKQPKKEKKKVKYDGPINLSFFYHQNNKLKKYALKNGQCFYVHYDGKYHVFCIDIRQNVQIKPIEFSPGSIANGIKVSKCCIIQVLTGYGSNTRFVGEFKAFSSKHNEKLCVLNMTRTETKIARIFVNGFKDSEMVEALMLINTKKKGDNDAEGKIYFDIRGLGIYIKRGK